MATATLPVVVSLQFMANEVDHTEAKLTARTAEAALKSVARHLGETQQDYAVWDDAVRHLYGEVDSDFVAQNFGSSTDTGTLFDTAYLLAEDGADVLGFRSGKPAPYGSSVAFPGVLADMVAELPSDPRTHAVQVGYAKTPWGISAIAAGAVIPNSAAVAVPKKPRILVLGKTLDEAAIQRLGEDFQLQDLELRNAESAPAFGISLKDASGKVIAQLAWAPPNLGSAAHRQVTGPVLVLISVLTVAGLASIGLAIRNLQRREELVESIRTQEHLLEATISNIPHGLCIFDGDKRLLRCNRTYADLYALPDRLIEPGTPLKSIVEYRRKVGNVPLDALDDEIDLVGDAQTAVEFQLQDGRTIRLNCLSRRGGGYVATHEEVSEKVRAVGRTKSLAGLVE